MWDHFEHPLAAAILGFLTEMADEGLVRVVMAEDHPRPAFKRVAHLVAFGGV